MKYAIAEIKGRQYLVKPGQIIEVDKLSEAKTLSVDKVMLLVEENKVEVGKPYLDKTLQFDVLGNAKKEKVRVATYKAKANYRRVKGQKREVTQIKLVEEGVSAKESKAKTGKTVKKED